MRHGLAWMACVWACAGCMHDAVTLVDAGTWNRLKPKPPSAAPDIVELHYIFIEREWGNPILNEKVWAEADEQSIPLDLKSGLNRNGLRIGKLGARLSPEMMALLENANHRGEGRKHNTRAGSLVKVQMTEVLPLWNLFTLTSGSPQGEEIADAQGYLHLTPTIEDETRVRLAIVPQIEFGPRQSRRMPAPDLTGWQIRSERDARAFPDLTVTLDIQSGEFALIGCVLDRPGTIGDYFFRKDVGGQSKQVALLMRVIRPSREELYTAGYDLDAFFLSSAPTQLPYAPTNARVTALATRRVR